MRGSRITLYNRQNEEVQGEKSKAWEEGNPYLASTIPQGPLLPTKNHQAIANNQEESGGFVRAYNRTKDESDALVVDEPVRFEQKECPRQMISGTPWERSCYPISDVIYPPYYVNDDFSAHFEEKT
jgi:hypothetical protein